MIKRLIISIITMLILNLVIYGIAYVFNASYDEVLGPALLGFVAALIAKEVGE